MYWPNLYDTFLSSFLVPGCTNGLICNSLILLLTDYDFPRAFPKLLKYVQINTKRDEVKLSNDLTAHSDDSNKYSAFCEYQRNYL